MATHGKEFQDSLNHLKFLLAIDIKTINQTSHMYIRYEIALIEQMAHQRKHFYKTYLNYTILKKMKLLIQMMLYNF